MLRTSSIAIALIAATITQTRAYAVSGDLQFALDKEIFAERAEVAADDCVLDWTPLSIKALGYDIREQWKLAEGQNFTFTLAFSR